MRKKFVKKDLEKIYISKDKYEKLEHVIDIFFSTSKGRSYSYSLDEIMGLWVEDYIEKLFKDCITKDEMEGLPNYYKFDKEINLVEVLINKYHIGKQYYNDEMREMLEMCGSNLADEKDFKVIKSIKGYTDITKYNSICLENYEGIKIYIAPFSIKNEDPAEDNDMIFIMQVEEKKKE